MKDQATHPGVLQMTDAQFREFCTDRRKNLKLLLVAFLGIEATGCGPIQLPKPIPTEAPPPGLDPYHQMLWDRIQVKINTRTGEIVFQLTPAGEKAITTGTQNADGSWTQWRLNENDVAERARILAEQHRMPFNPDACKASFVETYAHFLTPGIDPYNSPVWVLNPKARGERFRLDGLKCFSLPSSPTVPSPTNSGENQGESSAPKSSPPKASADSTDSQDQPPTSLVAQAVNWAGRTAMWWLVNGPKSGAIAEVAHPDFFKNTFLRFGISLRNLNPLPFVVGTPLEVVVRGISGGIQGLFPLPSHPVIRTSRAWLGLPGRAVGKLAEIALLPVGSQEALDAAIAAGQEGQSDVAPLIETHLGENSTPEAVNLLAREADLQVLKSRRQGVGTEIAQARAVELRERAQKAK